MKQQLSLFSVPYPVVGTLYALVPGDKAIQRLCKDDPIWKKVDVYTHWTMSVDVQKARVKLRDRIKFWVAA